MPFFDIFASPRWSPLHMRTKVASFFIFFQELSNKKKIKALRPKMTKIASRGGSCLKCYDTESYSTQTSDHKDNTTGPHHCWHHTPSSHHIWSIINSTHCAERRNSKSNIQGRKTIWMVKLLHDRQRSKHRLTSQWRVGFMLGSVFFNTSRRLWQIQSTRNTKRCLNNLRKFFSPRGVGKGGKREILGRLVAS